jgi:hypothetical protein
MGCKVRDPVIRSKFLATFDKSLATGLFSRLHYSRRKVSSLRASAGSV